VRLLIEATIAAVRI